jgi:hypothetical protein
MWEAIVQKLVGGFGTEVAGYYRDKQKLKHDLEMERMRGKVEWEKALTRRASESEGRDHEWELESIRNSGWKDEWVLVVLTIPMVLVFFPITQPYIAIGFDHLQSTPDW